MSCPDDQVAFYPEAGVNEFHILCLDPNALPSGIGNLQAVGADPKAEMELEVGYDMDRMWHIIAGAWVFLMQAGFAMLEAGSVSRKNTINILFKNLLDVSIAAISFYLLGYGFAYGESAGGFIGVGNFALVDELEDQDTYHEFFFDFTFAATAATIVSGSVAERTKLGAYFIYSLVITALIYPVVVHWGWSDDGWLINWGTNGFLDFAGSGIVHMVGGFAGLVGAIVVGPRKGRFEVNEDGSYGEPLPMPGHSMVLNSLGVIILWFGWYGFNGGSTLCVYECMDLVAKVCVTTTLAAAACATTATFYTKFTTGKYDLNVGLNAVIAGLVSITAPCAYVEPWAAYVIGVIGAFVYIGFDKLLLKLKIDDPLQASALHGACGFWGVVAVGIFATGDTVAFAEDAEPNGAVRSGEQFGIQLVGALAILAWTLATSSAVFFGIKYTIGMRVDEDVEEAGLDDSEHGNQSYIIGKSDTVKA